MVLLSLGFFLLLSPGTSVWAAGRTVDVIRLQGAINSVTAGYLDRGLTQAARDRASAVVIELDTPGGDLGSLEDMIRHMDASPVPTVVYVYPQGAWAGSAGTFVTMAADIAAMAPGTSIGAASPVGSGGQTLGATERKKVTNFAIAYIKAQARDHGHNVQFAAQAVQSAKAIPYDEALKNRVINVVANDLPSLLRKIDGTTVKTANGSVTFHTAGAAVRTITMNWTEQLEQILIDPNLVLTLLSVGTLALIFELSSPGAILPGIVGVISISIALFALGSITVDALGFVLIAFGILLFIADVKLPTHGFLTVGGLISFVLGSILLFSPSGVNGPSLNPLVAVAVAAVMAGFFGFVVKKAVAARKWSVKTGTQALLGKTAVVRERLNPEGMVFFDGALWNATTELPPIDNGVEVLVTEIEGLTVHVTPLLAGEPPAPTTQRGPRLEAGPA